MPPFDDPRVTGLGQRVSAEVGADQQRVRIGPAGSGLGLGKGEPAVDEFAGGHVEFPHDSGVRPAAGQADQGSGELGVDDVGAGPHPVLVIGVSKLIDVDQHVPVRAVAAVAVQRGAPPQPARVGGIAPEVVQIVAATAHVGNPGVGVEYLERFGAHALELLAGELGQRRLVAGAHPVQRLLAEDVFQPQIGVDRLVTRHATHSYGGGSVTCITPSNEELIR